MFQQERSKERRPDATENTSPAAAYSRSTQPCSRPKVGGDQRYGQEKILTVRISRVGWEKALSLGVLTSFEPKVFSSPERWQGVPRTSSPCSASFDASSSVLFADARALAVPAAQSGPASLGGAGPTSLGSGPTSLGSGPTSLGSGPASFDGSEFSGPRVVVQNWLESFQGPLPVFVYCPMRCSQVPIV